jgi:hypothetical protein
MDIKTPELYRKTQDHVVRDAEEGLRGLNIGWDGREGGPGWAFVRLFGRLSELAVKRLNQVPDKHFYAFLNSAGIDFVAPTPAETELAFTPAKDAPDSVLIPSGSQMATAKSETGPEIVFETAKDITMTHAVLTKTVVIDPLRISDRTGEASGLEDTSYPAFEGVAERMRALYLGGDVLFAFDDETQRAGTTVILDFRLRKPGGPSADGWIAVWSYFDGADWKAWPKGGLRDGTNNFSTDGWVEFTKIPELAPASVPGSDQVYLRCTLEGGTGRKQFPVIANVRASRMIAISSVQVAPAHVYSAIQAGTVFVPVDPAGEFFPLGQKPSRLDSFYIHADDAFGKEGGSVTVSMTVDHAPDSTSGQTWLVPSIVWEYFTAGGWKTIEKITRTNQSFLSDGAATAQFDVPAMDRTTVDGNEGFWIRARLSSGSYDKPGKATVSADKTSVTWDPPVVCAPLFNHFKLALTYSDDTGKYLELSHVSGAVDGASRDFSKEAAAGSPFSPFLSADEGPSFYMGFDRAFPADKWIQVRVDVDEDALDEEFDTPVTFEYFNGRDFAPLKVSDGTLGFKSKGYLGFFAPQDHAILSLFGSDAFWIRISPEKENVEGPYLKTVRTNTVPAVNAETFRDVVLGSSDGKADQVFHLPRTKVMPGLVLAVHEADRPGDDEIAALAEEIGGSDAPGPVFPYDSDKWVRWVEVFDFYSSKSTSRHFCLDPVNGTIRFGDGVQGAIPPIGRDNIRLVTVRYHDGARGNVAGGAVSVVRNPAGDLAAVKRVTNIEDAAGGSDVESLDDIRQRGPQRLKHRQRSVTLEDYEWLARESGSQVKNAKCFPVTDALGKMKAGHVTVVITPESTEKKPVPGPSLIRKVRTFIENHSLVNLMTDKNIHIKGPSYVECSVNVDVTPLYPEKSDQVELAILKRLDAFLHPLTGGPDRTGWTLGRDVYLSEISAEIEQVDGVDHVNATTFGCSLIQFHLDFAKEKNRFRRVPFDLASGSRIATFDESVRCLLADPVKAGASLESVTGYGFKAGDTVILVSDIQEEILGNLKINRVTVSVSNTDGGTALAWEVGFDAPFERPAGWSGRAGLMSADGKLRMPVAMDEILDDEDRVTAVVVRAFGKTDKVCVVQGSLRDPGLEFIPVSKARVSTHRVFVPEDCLVYSGTHDVNMMIGD